VSDSVSDIRRAAEVRMRELAPAIREAAQLQKVLAATAAAEDLDLEGLDLAGLAEEADRQAAGPERGSGAEVLRPRRGPDGRSVRGSNRSVILRVVRDNPGISSPEIAAITDLKREVISATIYRLKRQGVLEGYGRGVRVVLADEEARERIRRLAESRPGIDQIEIADATGLDPVVVEVSVEHLRKSGALEDGVGVAAGAAVGV
jgi:hypothetical protein